MKINRQRETAGAVRAIGAGGDDLNVKRSVTGNIGQLNRVSARAVGNYLHGDGILQGVENVKARLEAVDVQTPNNRHQVLRRAGGTRRTLDQIVFTRRGTGLVSLDEVIEALIRAGVLG